MRKLALVLTGALLLLAVHAEAQAVCEGVTGNGRCSGSNAINFLVPTTNTDGTVFNDYATTEVIYALSSPVCANGQPVVAATIKNVGAVGIPISPVVNTTAVVPMAVIGLPNGKVFTTVRVADTAGNRSGCGTPEITFTFDNLPPSPPTLQSVK